MFEKEKTYYNYDSLCPIDVLNRGSGEGKDNLRGYYF